MPGNKTLEISNQKQSPYFLHVKSLTAAEEAKEAIFERDVLLTILNDISSVHEKKDLLPLIRGNLKTMIPFDELLIAGIDHNQKKYYNFLHSFESLGELCPDLDNLMGATVAVDDPLMRAVMEASGPVVFIVGELMKIKNTMPWFDLFCRRGIQQVVAIAIKSGQQNAGIFFFAMYNDVAFTEADLHLLKTIAGQLGLCVANMFAQETIAACEHEKSMLLELSGDIAMIRDQKELLKVLQEQVIEISGFKKQLEVENLYLQEEIQTTYNYSEIIGESAVLKKVFQLVSSVAATPSSVLILGETGVGKELIARAIHNTSPRRDKLMVKVNCATLPANLIESELFGHEKGSFTGATDRRIGKFELANNSTLFLDEIGEMPLDLQVKLLRALQEKEIERVGGRTVIKTDVRIIAATNRDLEKEVAQGRFRSDLFFRLNVFPIFIPSLRERKEDIPVLATHFLHKHAKKLGKKIMGFSGKVIKQLSAYHWPGNVRELEHMIERSILLSKQQIIHELHLPMPEDDAGAAVSGAYIKTIDEVEREHIMHILKSCKGKVAGPGGAAEALRIPSTTLNSKIKKLKIKKKFMV